MPAQFTLGASHALNGISLHFCAHAEFGSSVTFFSAPQSFWQYSVAHRPAHPICQESPEKQKTTYFLVLEKKKKDGKAFHFQIPK